MLQFVAADLSRLTHRTKREVRTSRRPPWRSSSARDRLDQFRSSSELKIIAR